MVNEIVYHYLSRVEKELGDVEYNEKVIMLTELESHIIEEAQEMAKAQGLKKPTVEIFEKVIEKLGDPEKIGKGLGMTELKSSLARVSFVDHPTPSTFLLSCFLLGFMGCALGILVLIWGATVLPILLVILLGTLWISGALVCAFYIWLIYTTYYTLATSGITVKYGPWERTYPWDVFDRAYIQQGKFSSKIGWTSVTPCVRFSDAIVLKRKEGWSLYLTPNDIRDFLRKVSQFAEDLTYEARPYTISQEVIPPPSPSLPPPPPWIEKDLPPPPPATTKLVNP